MKKRQIKIPCQRCGEPTDREKYCAPCYKIVDAERKRKFALENKESIKESQRKKVENNPEKYGRRGNIPCVICGKPTDRMRYCLDCSKIITKEKSKLWIKNNKERMVELTNNWKDKNPDKVKESKTKTYRKRRQNGNEAEYINKKYKTNIQYKISCCLRARLHSALDGRTTPKSQSTLKLLGCTIDHLKSHLENLWVEGMSWDNYGYRGWHIDHIIPCASFDLSQPGEQEKCFHYTNLQPLWGIDNLKKNAKVNFTTQ